MWNAATALASPIASSSACILTHPAQSSAFSTSTVALTLRHKVTRAEKKQNKVDLKAFKRTKQQRRVLLQTTKPHPILGYGPGKEDLWLNSLLKKTIISPKEVYGETISMIDHDAELEAEEKAASRNPAEIQMPERFNYGLDKDSASLLLEVLPQVAAKKALFNAPTMYEAAAEKQLQEALEIEYEKRDKLMRIIDLKNSDSAGIRKYNMTRIVEAFGRKPNDTGCPEVQAALATYKIRNIVDHLKTLPRDIHSQHPLRLLVHRRHTILKYLKKVDIARYEKCLKDIGVESRSVEGHIELRTDMMRRLIRPVSDYILSATQGPGPRQALI